MLLRYFTLVFAYVAGVCVLQRLPVLPPAWQYSLAAGVLLVVAWCFQWIRTFALIVGVALLGFAYADWRAERRMADRLPAALEGQVVEVEGYVADLPQATRFGSRFLFVPEKVVTADARLPGQMQISWYGDKNRVQAGERWRLVLKPKRPHGQVNPGSFDLESWFLQQGIGATATVQHGQKLDGMADMAWLARIRSSLRERIRAALPDAPYTGVIVALTVGDQGGIPPEQWRRFSATGVIGSRLLIDILAMYANGLL